MLCPYCHGDESRVVDKRDNKENSVTRRRRECLSCNKRFTTYERIETITLFVHKKSGKVEEFDREKLKKGILKAVKKRPITEHQVDELIDDIELKLMNRKSNEIKTNEIGSMVLTRLKKIDKIGYVLFASVYNDFNSLEDFETTLVELKQA